MATESALSWRVMLLIVIVTIINVIFQFLFLVFYLVSGQTYNEDLMNLITYTINLGANIIIALLFYLFSKKLPDKNIKIYSFLILIASITLFIGEMALIFL